MFGGLTAAVVALPLSLAFGVASGLGAIEGLYSAIAVGLIAAALGGTRTQISGPTAPLSVAMSVVVASYADSIAEALTIVMLAGAIQILMGSLRLGSFVAYTPYSVISGFMSGVGVIIILVQTLPLLGLEVALGGPLESVRSWPDALADTNFDALTLGVITLVVCAGWPAHLKKVLPPTVAALIVGTLIGALWLTDAPVIGEVPSGLPDLVRPALSASSLSSVLQPAVTLALIGSINSLLTAMVADSMTRDRHNPNRELIGVGIANVVAGVIGAVPGAGATSGTVANVRAGGRTRVSAALCATVLLALVLGLGRYVDSIPHAVLAGILIKVGADIIDWRFITRIHLVQREHLLVMMVTLGSSILFDLVVAVAAGLIVAALASARQFERLQLDSVVSVPLLDRHFLNTEDGPDTEDGTDEDGPDTDEFSARVGMVALRGTFTVASSRKLIHTISMDIKDHEVVLLDFSDTVYIDDSAALVVEQLIDVAVDEDTECIVMGLSGRAATCLQSLNVLRRVPSDHFVQSLDEARDLAHRLLTPGG